MNKNNLTDETRETIGLIMNRVSWAKKLGLDPKVRGENYGSVLSFIDESVIDGSCTELLQIKIRI